MRAIDHAQPRVSSHRRVEDLLTRAATTRTRPVVARLARVGLVATDLLAVAAAMAAVHRLGPLLPADRAGETAAYARVCVLSLPLWTLVFHRYRLYNSRHTASRRDELGRILHGVGVSVVATAVVAYALDALVARSWLMALFVLALVVVVLEREVVRHAFSALHRRGHCLRPVVIAGIGEEAFALATTLGEQPELGYRVVGLIGDAEDEIDPRLVEFGPVLDGRTKPAEQVRMAGASGVIVATTDVDLQTSNRLTRSLTDAGIHVELSSSLKDIDADRLSVRPLGRFPVVYVEPVRREGWPQVSKRAFDITLALVLLVVSLPVLVAAAVAIKLSSPGPVLFKQERVGRRGRRFHVLKLRTMVIDAEDRLAELDLLNEADGPLFKIRQDPRVTRVGRLLRKFSLDELPQLVNVLRGEMSLVGPRPALPSEVTQWGPELFDRLRVQPGITGMWQVRGRSDSSFAQYARWDLYYVDNWSIAHDLGILLRTVPVVLSQKGAY
ncbi:MAG TPA: sugar transferase [Acidimicrobiales bacterium]|nr:sugar transferase [Acidimicrobiales bacterium]